MDHRERVRLLMTHLRTRRKLMGLCPACGLVETAPGTNCEDCKRTRRIKYAVVVAVTALHRPVCSTHTVH